MRTFAEVEAEQERDLRSWMPSRVGNLFLPDEVSLPMTLFRRFEGAELRWLTPYVEISEACRSWIGSHADLAPLVEFQAIFEIGVDFVARPYKPAETTFWTYEQQEQPDWDVGRVEPEPELAVMRSILAGALAGEADGREAVVRSVLHDSLMIGSGKTVDGWEGTFQVLEPSIGPEHLDAWLAAPDDQAGLRRWQPVTPAGVSGRGALDSLSLYHRVAGREYFEAELADRWQQQWWGLPGLAAADLAMADRSDILDLVRTGSGSPELRGLVANYLDAAQTVIVGQVPMEQCRFCDDTISVASYQSDGRWLWPDDLGHRVRRHGFYVPNRMVDYIRAVGSPPETISIPVEKLPWPKS